MNDFTPRPGHFILALLFMLTGAGILVYLPGWDVAGWGAIGLGVLIGLWMPVESLIYANSDLFQAQAQFCRAFNELDPEGRDALGLRYPRLRVRMNAEAKVTVDYSGVELRYFKKFIDDSDIVYISPESHWNYKTRAWKQWTLWKKYLEQENAIIPNSARGPKTWAWRQGMYERYRVYLTMRIPREMLPEAEKTPAGLEPLPEIPAEQDILAQF